LFYPERTNILLLGIDYSDPGNAVARTDSIILFTFNPLKPTIGMLSIPRDLWVTVPGVGENRINTAHFYAENLQPGSGPTIAMEVVSLNFGVNVDYYLRIRFEGFREIVDALHGVDLILKEPMAGYPAGKVHLTGRKALAFVRDRTNTDDFFRMSQGQVMLKALFMNMLKPVKWIRLPAVFKAFFNSVDTSIPVWEWPRLTIALLRAGSEGIQSRLITRDMVKPYMTDQGANVLLPNWAAIRPIVKEIFGQ
jgi:LCP family protein required for cell wall assembly